MHLATDRPLGEGARAAVKMLAAAAEIACLHLLLERLVAAIFSSSDDSSEKIRPTWRHRCDSLEPSRLRVLEMYGCVGYGCG